MRIRYAGGHGGFPLIGSPDDVAAELAQISADGFDGYAFSFVNYTDELPFLRCRGAPAARTARRPRAGLGEHMPQIRIGSTAQEAFSAVFFAVDQGRFQEAGLNVDVTTLSTGNCGPQRRCAAEHTISASQRRVGLANAVIAGLPFVMIAPAALTTPESPGGVICVGDTSPVKSAKDLEGQTVVIPALKNGQRSRRCALG